MIQPYLFLFVFLFGTWNALSEDKWPPRMIQLKESWSAARARALTPIDKKYVTALQALKKQLTQSGNLEGAMIAKREIERIEGEVTNFIFKGKWRATQSDGYTFNVQINPDGTGIDQNGKTIKWKIHANKIRIEYANSSYDQSLDIDNSDFNVLKGAYPKNRKAKITWTRIP